MQMGTGDAACGPHFSDNVTLLHIVTSLDLDLGEMKVKSKNAETVIQDDGMS